MQVGVQRPCVGHVRSQVLTEHPVEELSALGHQTDD